MKTTNPIFEAFGAVGKFGGLLVFGVPFLMLIDMNFAVPWGLLGELAGASIFCLVFYRLAENLEKGIKVALAISLIPTLLALYQGASLVGGLVTSLLMALILVLALFLASHFIKKVKRAVLELQLKYWMA